MTAPTARVVRHIGRHNGFDLYETATRDAVYACPEGTFGPTRHARMSPCWDRSWTGVREDGDPISFGSRQAAIDYITSTADARPERKGNTMTSVDNGTQHTCYDGLASDCPACKENFDASPAGIVAKAIEVINSDDSYSSALGDLLQLLSDEMSDEKAEEREYPNLIPSARWQVADWRYGEWRCEDRWTYALAVARSILGLPDPNKVGATA